MPDLKIYDSALQYGATIGAADLASSAVTAVKIASGAVTGAKLSTTLNYTVIAVPIQIPQGTNAVFGVAGTTAPVTGTITGFFVVSASATAGTTLLYAATAGTIAIITFGTSAGVMVGTSILNAAVTAGDTVYLTGPNAGSATGYVTFQTAS